MVVFFIKALEVRLYSTLLLPLVLLLMFLSTSISLYDVTNPYLYNAKTGDSQRGKTVVNSSNYSISYAARSTSTFDVLLLFLVILPLIFCNLLFASLLDECD